MIKKAIFSLSSLLLLSWNVYAGNTISYGKGEKSRYKVKILTNHSLGPGKKLKSLKKVNKKPLLIQYVIDNDEPFLKSSIYTEVNSLKKICKSEFSYIDTIFFINSLILSNKKEGPTIFGCKEGKFITYKPDKQIKDSIKKFSDTSYPLVDPNIYKAFMIYTNSLFSQKNYGWYLHIKSHRTKNLLVAGQDKKSESHNKNIQLEILKKLGLQYKKDLLNLLPSTTISPDLEYNYLLFNKFSGDNDKKYQELSNVKEKILAEQDNSKNNDKLSDEVNREKLQNLNFLHNIIYNDQYTVEKNNQILREKLSSGKNTIHELIDLENQFEFVLLELFGDDTSYIPAEFNFLSFSSVRLSSLLSGRFWFNNIKWANFLSDTKISKFKNDYIQLNDSILNSLYKEINNLNQETAPLKGIQNDEKVNLDRNYFKSGSIYYNLDNFDEYATCIKEKFYTMFFKLLKYYQENKVSEDDISIPKDFVHFMKNNIEPNYKNLNFNPKKLLTGKESSIEIIDFYFFKMASVLISQIEKNKKMEITFNQKDKKIISEKLGDFANKKYIDLFEIFLKEKINENQYFLNEYLSHINNKLDSSYKVISFSTTKLFMGNNSSRNYFSIDDRQRLQEIINAFGVGYKSNRKLLAGEMFSSRYDEVELNNGGRPLRWEKLYAYKTIFEGLEARGVESVEFIFCPLEDYEVVQELKERFFPKAKLFGNILDYFTNIKFKYEHLTSFSKNFEFEVEKLKLSLDKLPNDIRGQKFENEMQNGKTEKEKKYNSIDYAKQMILNKIDNYLSEKKINPLVVNKKNLKEFLDNLFSDQYIKKLTVLYPGSSFDILIAIKTDILNNNSISLRQKNVGKLVKDVLHIFIKRHSGSIGFLHDSRSLKSFKNRIYSNKKSYTDIFPSLSEYSKKEPILNEFYADTFDRFTDLVQKFNLDKSQGPMQKIEFIDNIYNLLTQKVSYQHFKANFLKIFNTTDFSDKMITLIYNHTLNDYKFLEFIQMCSYIESIHIDQIELINKDEKSFNYVYQLLKKGEIEKAFFVMRFLLNEAYSYEKDFTTGLVEHAENSLLNHLKSYEKLFKHKVNNGVDVFMINK